jgi:hypothetical protein
MKPRAFSFSALETFVNCPEQYHHKYVLKDLPPEIESPQQLYGTSTHKHFQDRLESNVALPDDLKHHEVKMQQMLTKDGIFWCEEKVALDKRLQPCRWDDPNILWRGIIDWRLVDRWENSATLVDYKTGKPHQKWKQLAMFAIHTFAAFPKVEIVNAQFYWTKLDPEVATTKKVWGRADIEQLWLMFAGDLKQYIEAYKTDVWQMRPSGLCAKWCPVLTCPHNGRRKGGKYEHG